ncbi:MAG: GFA family protein [Arenimonas sp.]
MLKTYHGSCHCGAVRFEADIDFTQTTYRCNCSVCTKTRFWAAVAKPEAFRLLGGESELTEYLFNTKKNQHFFCKHCGVRSFGVGNSPDVGKMVGVSVNCLDDASPEELIKAPIIYVDGRHDLWHLPPDEIRHL